MSLPRATLLFSLISLAAIAAPAGAQSPWPAESWSAATNLTGVEGPIPNDFGNDLSGAFWNPLTRRLWLCRNGPTATTSKMWALAESGPTFIVDSRAGNRAEWTSFGDFEALTQVDPAQEIIYAMIEGEEVIKSYSVGTYGAAILQRSWNTRPFLPLSGGLGAEGLAFIPDAHLRAAGFVDPLGNPYTSTRGMGGLMFVGHQNGGRIYTFDLDPASNTFSYVGAYLTGDTETAELCFDRSTGQLLAWHGNLNRLEVLGLGSTIVGNERKLTTIASYSQPTGAPGLPNIEGLAIVANDDGLINARSLFLTIDDGGATSLLWFKHFPTVCRADINHSGTLSVQDLFDFLAGYFSAAPWADFNFSGTTTVQDLFDLLAAYFAGC